MKLYALRIVQPDGQEEFFMDELGREPACFPSHAAAQRQQLFLLGQSTKGVGVKIVPHPKSRKPVTSEHLGALVIS